MGVVATTDSQNIATREEHRVSLFFIGVDATFGRACAVGDRRSTREVQVAVGVKTVVAAAIHRDRSTLDVHVAAGVDGVVVDGQRALALYALAAVLLARARHMDVATADLYVAHRQPRAVLRRFDAYLDALGRCGVGVVETVEFPR